MIKRVLIDDRGRLWPVPSYELSRYFAGCGSTDELLDFATRNMGCALVGLHVGGPVVRLRPDYFSEQSLETLIALLASLPCRRLMLRPVGPNYDGYDELLGNVEEVVVRLDLLRQRNPVAQSSFVSNPMQLSQARSSVSPAIREAIESWRRNRGRLDRAKLSRMLDRPFDAPMTMARLTGDDVPVVWTMPAYITFWNQNDRERLLGTPMTDHPDPIYSAKAAYGFGETARRDLAQFQIIDAVVRPANAPARQLRYERLMLPWTAPDGERLVSSASATRVERLISSST